MPLLQVNRRTWVFILVLAAVAAIPVTLYVSGAGTPPPSPFRSDETPPTPLMSMENTAGFVGSDACKPCHLSQFADHDSTLHAHTVLPIDAPSIVRLFQTDQRLEDPTRGVTYTFTVKNGMPVNRITDRKTGKVTEVTPKFAVGSGKYCITPVYERKGSYMETRTSYYPPMRRWYWTPGQQDPSPSRMPEGRIMPRDESALCFLCHGTMIAQSDEQPVESVSRLNIGCERCHGPGKEHTEAARRGKPKGGLYTYRSASSGTLMQLCNQCHRQPTNDLQIDLERDPNLPRFAGTALAASKCYKQSPGKLHCITCHDPHKPVSTDAKYYERICLSCHTGGQSEQKPCPVNPRTGCVPCHMPAQSINFPGGAKFHNHWIKPHKKDLVQAFEMQRKAPHAP